MGTITKRSGRRAIGGERGTATSGFAEGRSRPSAGGAGITDLEYAQRLAMERRRRPAWADEIDEAPVRMPPAVLPGRLPALPHWA